MSLNNLKINLDVQYLPSRFVREERIRFGRPGTAPAKVSAQYVDQKTGRIFKTKGELQSFLGNKLDLSVLDFNTGKLSQFMIKKTVRKRKTLLHQILNEPTRQTVAPTLAKQKVQVLKTQPNSKVNHDLKPQINQQTGETVNPEKARQVFWEKRLGAYKTIDDEKFDLPKNIQQFGPEVDTATAVRSIAAALHLNDFGICGQKSDAQNADQNPSIFINTDQPLVQTLLITDEDIIKQEERVQNARKRLAEQYKIDLVV